MFLEYIVILFISILEIIEIIIIISLLTYLIGRLFGAGFFKSKKQFFHDFLKKKEK